MTADAQPTSADNMDLSSDRLVRGIMAKRPGLGELLRLTAVPFWFEEGLVAALRTKNDGQEANIIALLDQFSFVHVGYGRYWYDHDMRQSLLEQWAEDPDGLAAAHRKALDYFATQLEDSPPDDTAIHQELAAAHLYHLLAVDETDGIQRLHHLFRETSNEYQLAAAEQYVLVADEQRPVLSSEARAHLDCLHGHVLQLYGQWPESQDLFQRMLERVDLPQAVRASAERGMARSLLEMDQASEAISHYALALEGFEEAADRLEIGLTRAAMGNAYLSLALDVLGSSWLRQPAQPSRFRHLDNLGHLLIRIPLVLYLLWRLGFRELLPVAHHICRDMDWIVARILVTAAEWFRKAEDILGSSPTQAGLVQVREGLAQLYRLLDDPQRAEDLNSEILGMPAVRAGGYRAARAKLGIAHCRLLKGDACTAAAMLEELLTVFRRFEHQSRTAQTLTLLGHAELLLDRPDEAVTRYLEALASWRNLKDASAITDIVCKLESIRNQPSLSPESRAAAREASQLTTRRHYRVRYLHPALRLFRQLSLIVLVSTFFFTIRLALRAEWGTQIDPTASLVKPIHRSVPTSALLSPDLSLTIDEQLLPNPPVKLVGAVVAVSFLGYLLLYAITGWLVIVTRPLGEVRPGRVQAVETNPEEIRLHTHGGIGQQLGWDRIQTLLRSDRIVGRHPLRAWSFFALFDGGEPIRVPARTLHYEALQGDVRHHLDQRSDPKMRVFDLGFDLLHSKSGWLFLASLVYVLTFFFVAVLWPQLVTQEIGPLPYNAVDLYSLAYLGLAFPLVWWFAVQPLRAHWLVRAETPVVWLVGAAGLALALFSVVQICWWHVPLGRPDMATALLAILLVCLAGSHIFRARQGNSATEGEFTYAPSLRFAVALLVTVTVVAMLFAIGWELVSFHHLVVGNSSLREAEKLKQEAERDAKWSKELAAVLAYEHALEAYTESLKMREEAYIYNSQGATLTRLGRYQEALEAFESAEDKNPRDLTFTMNRALVYESQVANAVDRDSALTLHDDAIRLLNQAIDSIEPGVGRHRTQLGTAHLLRGAAHYSRGQAYLALRDRARKRKQAEASEWQAKALEDFRRAFDDYDWLAAAAPDRADGFAGRGWAHFRLREEETEADGIRERLQSASNDFVKARGRDSEDISAKTGLAWTQYEYAKTYAACTRDTDPQDGSLYRYYLELAVRSYGQVIEQEPAAIHFWVRAHLQWLLRHCDGLTFQSQFEQARADYDEAISQDGTRASWYNTRGNFSYVLAEDYADPIKVEKARERAISDYMKAALLEPEELGWWQDLARVAYEWAGSGYWQDAIRGYREIESLAPNKHEAEAYWRLGWLTYLYLSDYDQSLHYSAKALNLIPNQAAVHFNQGLVHVALGDMEAATQNYLHGIKAADVERGASRKRRYGYAIQDLETVQADPKRAANGFGTLLEAARARQACTSVDEISYGLLVRNRPGPITEPSITVLVEGDKFLPGARSPDGAWLYVLVKGTPAFGWVNASPRLLSCPFDLDSLPVVDPSLVATLTEPSSQ